MNKITSLIYSLEFNRSDASQELLSELDAMRPHHTGILSDSSTLSVYIGMSERVDMIDNGTGKLEPFPTARHNEHIADSTNVNSASHHLDSRQALKKLFDAGIEVTCRVLHTYTETNTEYHEEYYRVQYLDHLLMNKVAGIQFLTDTDIKEVQSIGDIGEYAQRKKEIIKRNKEAKKKNKTDIKSKIVWPTGTTFTTDQKQFMVENFKLWLADTYKDSTGYAHKIINQMYCNPELYIFNEKRIDTRVINSKTIKKALKQIIMQDGYHQEIHEIPYEDMTIEQQIEYHMSPDRDNDETHYQMRKRMGA